MRDLDPKLVERATARARHFLAEGYSFEESIDRGIAEEILASRRAGLGADLLTEAQGAARDVSGMVSPWLWVLSIGSFVMAVLNRKEIARMYGSWKRAKATLLG